MNITSFLLVFVGGGFGSIIRYAIGIIIKPITPHFPYATLIANSLGCLLLGLILGFVTAKTSISNTHYTLFTVGFCGGLTTFSSFTLENMRFLEQGQFLQFLLYSLGTFTVGILFIYMGMVLHRQF